MWRLDRWLGALRIDRCHMLGHSRGTLIAARFAAEQPKRMISLKLASIASGHEIGDFLMHGGHGPEHQALLRLIETLVEEPARA
jgi:pimeloyl-ACP methyl ester carboxylesterase